MATRYKAKLDTFDLDLETISDSLENAIAVLECPMADKAELQHMGNKARRITFRCHFLNEKYDSHKDFLAHIAKNQAFELVHPVYGSMSGMITTGALQHGDEIDSVAIDISFVEGTSGSTAPTFQTNVVEAAEAAFQKGRLQQVSAMIDNMRVQLGAEGASIAAKDLDPERSLISQVTGITAKARAYLRSVDAVVSTLEGTLTDIANPATSLISTIDYGTTLPGRVLGAVAKTVERYSESITAVASAPSRFVDSFKSGMLELEAALPSHADLIRVTGALHASVILASIYQEDEDNRSVKNRADEARAFDILGRYCPRPAAPEIATVGELELSLATVRAFIQEGIGQMRQVDALKDAAAALLSHVNEIKIYRERVVPIKVYPSMPIHALCLSLGLPYTYADRILAINRIPDPSFVEGEVMVYVR